MELKISEKIKKNHKRDQNMLGFKPKIETSVKMIGRNADNFVKTMFGFKESYAYIVRFTC